MGFPQQERFTAEDLAKRWGKSAAYVAELIRTLQFTHITLREVLPSGAVITRHLYFDTAAFSRDYKKKIELEEDKARAGAAKYSALLADQEKDAGPEDKERIQRSRERFEVTPETVQVRKSSYDIGPDEVANLWDPWPDQKEWKRGSEDLEVYIPLSAAQAFEKKHGVVPGEKETHKVASDDDIIDLSGVLPLREYPLHRMAAIHKISLSYLRNNASRITGAHKRGRVWYVPGQSIIDYKGLTPRPPRSGRPK